MTGDGSTSEGTKSGSKTDRPLPEIPGFEIERELGRGGMAAVYLAREVASDRMVALKVLRLAAAQGSMAERFEQEAQLGAILNHPDVVQIHGHGRTDAHLWMAMEYLNGFELTQAMKDPEFGLEDRLNVMIRVAAAVHHVHEKGVLHRDIKPANIFMTYDGGVRLLDFGIARAAVDMRLTQSGMLVGTPQYMAPEQLTAEELDRRADVFSLGIVLYECVAGSLPWPADNPGRLIVDVCTRPPIPLVNAMERRRWTLDRRLREALERVVMKAIAVDPNARYNTALEFASTLGAFVSGEATSRPTDESKARVPKDLLETGWTDRRIEWARARAARLELEGSVDLPRARKVIAPADELIDDERRPERVWAALLALVTLGLATALWFALSP